MGVHVFAELTLDAQVSVGRKLWSRLRDLREDCDPDIVRADDERTMVGICVYDSVDEPIASRYESSVVRSCGTE